MKDRVLHVVAIAIVAIIVLSAFGILLWVSKAPSSTACPSALTRVGQAMPAPPLVLGSSNDTTKGTAHWYNFTIEYSSPCDMIGSLAFKVRSPNGSYVSLPGGAAAEIVGAMGLGVAAYNLSSDVWAYDSGYGPDSLITDQGRVSLYYSGESPSTIVGYSLMAYGATWTISDTIT